MNADAMRRQAEWHHDHGAGICGDMDYPAATLRLLDVVVAAQALLDARDAVVRDRGRFFVTEESVRAESDAWAGLRTSLGLLEGTP